MNMNVDEGGGKATGMVNGQVRNFWRFSSNGFCNNIGCIVSAPTFVIGGSRMWKKE